MDGKGDARRGTGISFKADELASVFGLRVGSGSVPEARGDDVLRAQTRRGEGGARARPRHWAPGVPRLARRAGAEMP